MQVPQSAPTGAQCAQHADRAATLACARCGNFMCDECSLGRQQSTCPPCRLKTGGDFPLSRNDYDFGRVWDFAFETFKREWLMLSVCALLMMMVGMVGGIVASIIQNIGMAVAGVKQPQAGSDFNWKDLAPFLGAAIVGQLIGMAINIVVQGAVQLGFFRVCIDALSGSKVNIERLFSQVRRLPDYIIAQLVIFFAVGLPSILLIVLPIGVTLAMAGLTSLNKLKHLSPEQVFTPVSIAVIALSFLTLLVFLIVVSLPLVFVIPEIVYGGVSGLEAIKRAWALGSGTRLSVFAVGLAGMLVAMVGVFACCVGMIPAIALTQLLMTTLYLAVRKGSGLPPPVES